LRDALISSIAVATLFAEEDISSATDEMELIFAVACSVEDATVALRVLISSALAAIWFDTDESLIQAHLN
jgi:hypothetical protein